ncbi:MAG: sigma-70 family RNA polymerase sigma factor [Desulfobacula sp.]|nr:sigma-70 family RNA polymerase sigma factor [Desulfobacula sp.]
MDKTGTAENSIDEQDLVERLQKGQQWAFNVLVDRYQDRLLRIAYGITLDHEDSIEVVQDVFVIVFKKIHTFRQDASLATWLRRITINQCLNWKRKWKRRFKWSHDSLESNNGTSLLNDKNLYGNNIKSHDPEILYQEKQFESNLKKAVKKLPEKLRVVFVLNSFEGLSYEQIAKTLDIKKGSVSSRLYWARKNLMKSLGMLKK